MDVSVAPRPRRRRVGPVRGLTDRQLQVLRLRAEGVGNAGIARRLWLSPDSVAQHLRLAREKLGARDTTHAVALAYERGLLGPGRGGVAA